MDEHPDSALSVLNNIDLPDNASDGDKALYNMLITHARYKNFIDERNDSLISFSVDYFSDKDMPEEASRSLFLAGMIQLNAGNYGESAVSFSRGLDFATDNKSYFWQGQCANGLFQVYRKLLDGSAQLKYAQMAKDDIREAW